LVEEVVSLRLIEEVLTLRRAAAFSRLQAEAFSWMRTVQHPW
jgi:hypothetical protein